MAELSSSGQSVNRKKSLSAAETKFELFRNSSPALQLEYPTSWSELPEAQVCCRRPYGQIAFWVTDPDDGYRIPVGSINSGEMLKCDPAMAVMTTLLNIAVRRFASTTQLASTKEFFTCTSVKGNTADADWMRGLKSNIISRTFGRDLDAGVPMDNSAACVYLVHTERMNKAYSKAGDAEVTSLLAQLLAFHSVCAPQLCSFECLCTQAAYRKLLITTLKRVAGRGGETVGMNYDGLQWDDHFRGVFIEVKQSKVSS